MNKRLFFLLLTIILAVTGGIAVFQYHLKPMSFISPLALSKNTESVAGAKAHPWDSFKLNPVNGVQPILGANAVLVADLTTQEILLEKNPDYTQPVASIQKIVTAIVTLDKLAPNTFVTVSQNAAGKEPDSMGLFPGEKLSVEQLLYGMLLESGNDAAVTLAEGAGGSETQFVKMMDAKIQSWGLENTHFVNASGLEDDGYQFSSAHDLLVISIHLLTDYPLLRKIVAAQRFVIEPVFTSTENHKYFDVQNMSPTADLPGYEGVKPGYTDTAGKCLITLIKNSDHEYLVIVLGSDDRKGDTEAILKFVTKGSFSLPPS